MRVIAQVPREDDSFPQGSQESPQTCVAQRTHLQVQLEKNAQLRTHVFLSRTPDATLHKLKDTFGSLTQKGERNRKEI